MTAPLDRALALLLGLDAGEALPLEWRVLADHNPQRALCRAWNGCAQPWPLRMALEALGGRRVSNGVAYDAWWREQEAWHVEDEERREVFATPAYLARMAAAIKRAVPGVVLRELVDHAAREARA